jgi:excisionase family DNA binding protein
MARPPLKHDERNGLTTTEVAKKLGCSPSYVRKLLEKGYFPKLKDGSGVYRFNEHNVAEVARKLGRVAKTDGATAAKVYGYFLAPGFKPTNEAIGRIVFETGEHPDLVRALWEKYKIGVGAPTTDQDTREMERLAREYDEQIAAMDEELARRRRAVFIPDDPPDDAPPSSRS